jgi:hypothetical protein
MPEIRFTEEDHAFAQEFVGRLESSGVAGTVREFLSRATPCFFGFGPSGNRTSESRRVGGHRGGYRSRRSMSAEFVRSEHDSEKIDVLRDPNSSLAGPRGIPTGTAAAPVSSGAAI